MFLWCFAQESIFPALISYSGITVGENVMIHSFQCTFEFVDFVL